MDSDDKLIFWILATLILTVVGGVVLGCSFSNYLDYKAQVLLIERGSETVQQVIKDITDIFKQ